MRYDTKDETGETRRERNDKHAMNSPVFEVPVEGIYLWQWYQEISSTVRRINEGLCGPIHPSEWLAWTRMTGNIVNHVEYDILTAMDRTFCDETNVELENLNIRRQEEHAKNLKEQAKS